MERKVEPNLLRSLTGPRPRRTGSMPHRAARCQVSGGLAVDHRKKDGEEPRYRCGYCLTSERIAGLPMEIKHLIPQVLGGPTLEENLWLACSRYESHISQS